MARTKGTPSACSACSRLTSWKRGFTLPSSAHLSRVLTVSSVLCSIPKERAAASESSWLRQEKTWGLGRVEVWAHAKQPEITDNSEELE